MLGVGGAFEAVHAQAEFLPGILKLGADQACELFGRFARSLGGALDFLAVLVGPGEKVDVLPAAAAKTRDRVGHERRGEMPNVRKVVHIGDRRRDVVLSHLSVRELPAP